MQPLAGIEQAEQQIEACTHRFSESILVIYGSIGKWISAASDH
jgi:hypothetical protein